MPQSLLNRFFCSTNNFSKIWEKGSITAMGQPRKDTRFQGVASPFSDVNTNIFYEMDGVHIQKVFDLLQSKFGFPRQWEKNWKQHLERSPRSEEEIGLFLRWGIKHIEPLLNGVLLRGSSHSTFSKMCEYIIYQSRKKSK